MNWRKGLLGLCATLALFSTPSFAQMSEDDIACSEGVPKGPYPADGVGTATMMKNGTICVLYNPFVDPESGSEIDEQPLPMLLVYAPSRPSYSAALREIGRLRPGETKVIRHYLKNY